MKPFAPVIPDEFAQIYENYQFAPAVRVGDELHISGVIGFSPDGSFPPEFRDQARNVFRQLDLILTKAGGTLGDIFSLMSYHVGDLPTQMPSFLQEKTAQLGAPHPAWTAVSVSGLAAPAALLEVSAIARLKA